ncbi:hypothetical protein FMA36_02205 [Komagataeibacter xylinus]|uniref:Uncharacterized protein n=1 Tax=Komagataeibacter xylinus TaxID=28448 RepID=A0A857FMH2_KOMXY|nr:hypothetical protein FMA36_02205 [Komagataeibacter xylinus]
MARLPVSAYGPAGAAALRAGLLPARKIMKKLPGMPPFLKKDGILKFSINILFSNNLPATKAQISINP